MAESLNVQGTTRKEQYESILPQIKALIDGEPNQIANLCNIMAALKYGMNFFWAGVYLVEGSELVLGPFQGPVACTRIAKGKGVCGYCFSIGKTVIVKDVDQFPGHISCNSGSKSEIVVPVFNTRGEICMVLDIDSDQLADFDETDRDYLEQLAEIIGSL